MAAGRLAGRHAVVTGGASGIGLASARRFLAEGARVALLDRDEAALGRAAAELGGVPAIPVDVSDARAAQAAVDRAARDLGGRIDAVVNAAGIARTARFADTTPELWREVMAVNLDGPFLVSRAALPHLRAAGGGSVVHIASAAGLTPRPGYTAYGTSKGGVVMLTRTMALDLAPENIRVNCVCPGAIRTPMVTRALEAAPDRAAAEAALLSRYAMRRLGTAEEVANLVLFLTSGEAGYVTGAAYTVDGGSVFH
jgi:NAD(P)-dependent dehydrogenase (short-subunit alcohol dehydrogenase family)